MRTLIGFFGGGLIGWIIWRIQAGRAPKPPEYLDCGPHGEDHD